MEEKTTPKQQTEAKETEQLEGIDKVQALFSIKFFIKTVLLNWHWMLLSVFIFLGIALLYVRYTPRVYKVSEKILIKDEDGSNKRFASNAIQGATNLGLVTTTNGFDNEMEILRSVTLAEGAVNDLKLYVDYSRETRITEIAIYKDSPVLVDMNKEQLDKLSGPVTLKITRNGSTYNIEGSYNNETFKRSGTLPMTMATPAGKVFVKAQPQYLTSWDGKRNIIAVISNPHTKAMSYAARTSVSSLSKTTSIAQLSLNDVIPARAIDYLKDIALVYNRQANEDKNQIAVRTEHFINDRIEKLNIELGSTDGAIQNFKRQNNMIDVTATAGLAQSNSNETEKSLTEMGTQILLLQSVKDFMIQPSNKYQALPSNVGLKDDAATSLISKYNEAVMERNRLLRTASEMSPKVQDATAELDDLTKSIKRALTQAMTDLKIQRDALAQQYNKYNGQMSQSPEQERILTEIGRQQTVKEGLYLMLLQKREENSIELAATADKGKLLDEPTMGGVVAPQTEFILLVGLAVGVFLPFFIFIILELLRFRIEGHEDVKRLSPIPIISDIPIANEKTKTKGDIVVHENKNNQMEEIFRSMRTNIQFMLKEDQNIIMLTSSTSGEGKTFVAANLAVSFALLGKKVLIIGLDIRRPRLTKLFGLKTKDTGISILLTKDSPTIEDIREQIMPSGVNENLDILPAGPVPPNPTEMLSRKTLDEIFALIKKEYDYIICDTAPVGLVTDTLQLARVSDATVFICRADYTEKSAFGLINELALTEKVPNACIAINGIDMSRKKYGYYYGYGKYGKYGKYNRYGVYSYNGSRSYGYKGYGYHSYGYGYGYGGYSNNHYGNPNDDSIKK